MSLEDQLRDVFTARAEAARSVDDPAGRAIRRARAVRRRRALGSGVALTAVAVLGLGGAVWAQAHYGPTAGSTVADGPLMLPGGDAATPPPPATPPPAPPPVRERSAKAAPPAPGDGRVREIGLDLRVGREVWTVGGARYELAGVAEVARVYRVPVGWVYGDARRVRLLRLDGQSIDLGSFGARWLVGPEGGRLATVRDRQLVVYRLNTMGLTAQVEVPVPADGRPVAFVGDQVVVSVGDRYAAFPPVDTDGPVWTNGVLSVYGSTTDSLAGLVQDPTRDEVCLASLEPGRGGLTVSRTGSCRTAKSAEAKALLAPGGAWLAEAGTHGTTLVDFRRALEDAQSTTACPVVSEVPPVWADDRTLVLANGRHAVRCRTDGYSEYVDLPTGLTEDWSFVPRLVPPEADNEVDRSGS